MRLKGRRVGEAETGTDFHGHILPGGLIRLDNGHQPEFWLEVELSSGELRELCLTRAHAVASHNRAEIEGSVWCACFQCVSWFPAGNIDKWTDHGETAMCPHCGIDAVIPDTSGWLKQGELREWLVFLTRMQQRWFGLPKVTQDPQGA